ncbi:DUF624 domain-containing protein [Saliterribacillus persicus]|uniref:Putative membrane protein YesL n=1 Tax=Saliterribacillus persicus TaxID=930114 RepID=A0A368YD33_9BACI|nr:DUF624 domain-containing protein [Saliterribacillus persicus]RCW77348.1 putative membrane protein YesL [Saliterribacillus persicus]
MNLMESRLYRFVEFFINLLLLNLLWLVCSFPVITIGPATAALYSVTKDFIEKKETRVIKPYFTYFKELFKKSLFIGLVVPILIIALIINFIYVLNYDNLLLLTFFLTFSLLVVAMATFIFPIMSIYKFTLIELIKNSLLFSILFLPVSLLNVSILISLAFATLRFPIMIFINISLSSFLIYLLCKKAFSIAEDRRIIQIKA